MATLGVGIVCWLFWLNRDRLQQLITQPVRKLPLALGTVSCVFSVLLTFCRWSMLVWSQGLPFRLRDGFRIGFIGYLFNQVIPGAVSGDLVKAVLLAREQDRRTVAIATVVIDRIVGMYALVLVAGLSAACFWSELAATRELRLLATWVAGVSGVGTIGFALLFTPLLYRPRLVRALVRLPLVGGALGEVLRAMSVYHERRRVILLAVLMSMVAHVGFIGSLWGAARSLPGDQWPLRVHYVVAPIGLSVNAIPLSPGGLGVGEAGMQQLFGLVGGDGAKAFVMMLAYRVMSWLIALAGVPYLVVSFGETRRAVAEAQEAPSPSS